MKLMMLALALLATPTLLAVGLILGLRWVAKGEPDVNGDTERDSRE